MNFDELYEGAMESSANFKRWFKGSKVVDSSGSPLVVYHGSPKGGFDFFDIHKLAGTSLMEKQGPGFYFTDKKNAKQYTKSVNKISSGGKSGLFDVYLSIKKPLRIKQHNSHVITLDQTIKLFQNGDKDYFYDSWVAFSKSGSLYNDKRWTKEEIDEMSNKEKGALFGTITYNGMYGDQAILEDIHRAYDSPELMFKNMRKILKADGVIYTDSYGQIYVAWESTQIKSASGNNGDFSNSNKSIYK